MPPWMPETAHTVSAYGPTLAGCRGGPCARPIREPVLDQRYSGPTQTTGAHKGRPYGLIPPEVALYALTLNPPCAPVVERSGYAYSVGFVHITLRQGFDRQEGN